MSKYKLINTLDRSKLAEGRNFGFACTTLLKKKNTLTVTTCPLTACRDFLNDIIWTQSTKKPYSIYGLKSEYVEGLFEKNRAYLLISIEKQGRDLKEYLNYKRDYETLKKNYKNLEKAINWFEKQFKIKSKTKIEEIEENRYLCIVPIFWTQGTYRISLYTLLLRTLMFWEQGDIIEFLKNFKHDASDTYIINGALPKIKIMLEGCIPEQDMSSIISPHNMGILSYVFPVKN